MTGEEIAAAARHWIGTRWTHQGRIRGAGVDCVGLLIGVARELKLADAALLDEIERSTAGYGRAPDPRLQALCRQHLHTITLDEIAPGDVLLMRFVPGQPQHVAIVARLHDGDLSIVHALLQARRVVEHRLDATWRARIVDAYRFPQVVPA